MFIRIVGHLCIGSGGSSKACVVRIYSDPWLRTEASLGGAPGLEGARKGRGKVIENKGGNVV